MRKISFHRKSGHHEQSKHDGGAGDKPEELKTFDKTNDEVRRSSSPLVRKPSSSSRVPMQRKPSQKGVSYGSPVRDGSHMTVVRQIESMQEVPLTCSVCLREYNKPKKLPCDHVACASCLQDYVNPKLLVCCPTCHKETPVLKGNTNNLPDDDEMNLRLEVKHKKTNMHALEEIPATKEQVSKRMEEIRSLEGSIGKIEADLKVGLEGLAEQALKLVEQKKKLIEKQGEQFQKDLQHRLEKEVLEAEKIKENFQKMYKLEKEAETELDESILSLKYKALIFDHDELKTKCLRRKNVVFTLNDDFSISESMKSTDTKKNLEETHKQHTSAPRLKKLHTFKLKHPSGAGVCPWNENIYICLPARHLVEVYNSNGVFQQNIESIEGFNLVTPVKVVFNKNTKQIYILDKWEGNVQCLQHLDQNEHLFVQTLISKGSLQQPCGLALDQQDNIYIADTGNSRVAKFDPYGQFMCIIGGTEQMGPDGKMQMCSTLNHPEDVNINFEGTMIVVADTGNNRVKLFDLDGQALREFGMKGSGHGMFEYPTCAVFHPVSNVILVGDSENHRIQAFTELGGYLKSYNGYQGISNIATSNTNHKFTLISASKDNAVVVVR